MGELGSISASDVGKARPLPTPPPVPRFSLTTAPSQIKAGGDGFGLRLYDPVRPFSVFFPHFF